MFDLIIRNATVIDGTRAPRFVADVGIRGDRIAAVQPELPESARQELNLESKILAPGFVDVHNHSDGWMLRMPHIAAKTIQGFTTEVLMADGISYAPVNTHTASSWIYYLRSLNGLRLSDYDGWTDIGDYVRRIDRRNVQNCIAHVPYANVRSMHCGFGNSAVDDFQMKQIRAEIQKGMSQGAVGVSTGLDYIAQCFSTTDELAEACAVMKEVAGLYVTHMRYKKGLLAGLHEAVEIGKRAQVPVHISHLKAFSPYSADQVLGYIDQVAGKEVDLTFDVYPYQPGSTMLNFLLPYEVWVDGPLAVVEKLQRPEIRERFRAGLESYQLDLAHMRFAWLASRDNESLQGMTLEDFISTSGKRAEDALCDLLMEERLAVLCVFDQGDDRQVWPFLQHPLFMAGSDGIFFPDGAVHPRVFGTAGRILGPAVRDWNLFSLEDAVYKLSGFPSQRFGLRDRGVIRSGAFADLVAFDEHLVSDRATYDNPRQLNVGVEHVFVNGKQIVRAGEPCLGLDGSSRQGLPGRALQFHK